MTKTNLIKVLNFAQNKKSNISLKPVSRKRKTGFPDCKETP